MAVSMWRGIVALAVLGGFVFAGSAGAHLIPADPVHIDFEFEPYVAGGTLVVRLFVSNPGNATASFWWPDGCLLGGSIYSERRILFSGPGIVCPTVVVALEVPPNSTVPFSWSILSFETEPDDGCIRFRLWLNRYGGVRGDAETCPEPAAPSPTPMVLTASAPASARAGETFYVGVAARTLEGVAIEGILVKITLVLEEVGTATTDSQGRAFLAIRAPTVNETTILSLLVQASGDGWRTESRARSLAVFPATTPHLIARTVLPLGDAVRGGGLATFDLFLRGSDDQIPTDTSIEVEVAAPLALEDVVDVGSDRHQFMLRASPVEEAHVVPVRVVANAPGYAGVETFVEFIVLPNPAPPLPGDAVEPGPGPIGPAIGLGFFAATSVVAAAAIRRWLRRRP